MTETYNEKSEITPSSLKNESIDQYVDIQEKSSENGHQLEDLTKDSKRLTDSIVR
jgi:hypothetical protein